MQIHELDPNKRYIISINVEHFTQEDALALKGKLEQYCAGAVVIAGPDVETRASGESRYWGLYCPQHNVWMSKSDGMFVQFDASPIAQAWLDTVVSRSPGLGTRHLWEVTEFGEAAPVDYKSPPPLTAFCPA